MQNPTKVKQLHLREVQAEDIGFLAELYASTREKEMDLLPWSAEQKKAFLNQQFSAQSSFYEKQFPKAAFQIITLGERAIGRLYVDPRPDEIRIVDIALLPEYRGKGFGTHFLKIILEEAKSKQKWVRIHVESQNPAMTLYERLGFQKVRENGIYFLMETKP